MYNDTCNIVALSYSYDKANNYYYLTNNNYPLFMGFSSDRNINLRKHGVVITEEFCKEFNGQLLPFSNVIRNQVVCFNNLEDCKRMIEYMEGLILINKMVK